MGLVAVDLSILVRLYLCLRSQAPLDRRVLFPVAAILLGGALFGLSGATRNICFVHLTTMCVAFGIYFSWSLKPKGKNHPDA